MRGSGISLIIFGIVLLALNGYVAGPPSYTSYGNEQIFRNERQITWAIWVGGAVLLAGVALILRTCKRQ